MNKTMLKTSLKYFIATVWLLNGLFCKVLNFVPRHEEIVKEVLQTNWSREIIILIGIGEILLALWVFLNIKIKLHTILQVLLVLTMNILEFSLVPHLLLWGELNIAFACAFVMLVLYHLYLDQNE